MREKIENSKTCGESFTYKNITYSEEVIERFVKDGLKMAAAFYEKNVVV
jgi:hypothetical protein